jgi:hypothetical protein
MLIKLTGTTVQTIGGRTYLAGHALDLPDPQARTLIDTGQAVPLVRVRLLQILRWEGVSYAPNETVGFDPKTADMLVGRGIAKCIPS